MGAINIDIHVDGDKSPEYIREVFKSQQAEDRFNNGHRDGYSGDFQTVDEVKISMLKFETYDEAYDYCLDKSEKWEHVTACRYKDTEGKLNWVIAGWGAC